MIDFSGLSNFNFIKKFLVLLKNQLIRGPEE